MNPPRIAQRIIRRTAHPDDRDLIARDIDRRFTELTSERGVGAARRWYWRQAVSVALWRLRPVGLAGVRFSWLDLKLGLRMLVKYPGLTAIGGLALAFATWVGAVTFEVVGQMVAPTLPLDEGDAIVAVLHRDVAGNRFVAPSPADFVAWEGQLGTFDELGAFRQISRNLGHEGGPTEPIELAEITPVGFQMTRVSPLLGRSLIESDAETGAPPVLVLGYDLWHTRFSGDPGIIGETVRLGRATTTVVGVMPEDFGFPVDHNAWVPLTRIPSDATPAEGRPVVVFGRLGEGQSLEAAQVELDVIGERRALLHPAELETLRPWVMPYASAVSPLPDIGPMGLLAANLFAGMLFVLICGSVALLVWARASTRRRELAVRSALGAGPGRIATQLFTEALVLTAAAAAVGLIAADYGVGWYAAMTEADTGSVPFWTKRGVSGVAVAYAALLTVLGAAVVGLLPAFKVARQNVDDRLRAVARSGGASLRGIWGAVVVAQIAVTVAFPATAFLFQRFVTNVRAFDLGLSGQAYLGARVELGESMRADRPGAVFGDLEDRLRGEPSVVGVTFAQSLPGMLPRRHRVDIEVAGAARLVPGRVGNQGVGASFFDETGSPLIQGRGFTDSDIEAEAGVIVVNEAFVDDVLAGRAAVGQRVRVNDPLRTPGPWLEIVGVVGGLTMFGGDHLEVLPFPGFYHPVGHEPDAPIRIAVQLQGTTVEGFVPRFRSIASAVDPDMRLHDVRDLAEIGESLWRESEFIYRVLGGISIIAIVLSLASIYSVLALTVSQRTREIGVRVALGSGSKPILVSTFGRPMVKVAMGIGLGGLMVIGLVIMMKGGGLSPGEAAGTVLYSLTMLGVCAMACIVPTARALSIEPTEALRVES